MKNADTCQHIWLPNLIPPIYISWSADGHDKAESGWLCTSNGQNWEETHGLFIPTILLW
jgi:hypothetical protein